MTILEKLLPESLFGRSLSADAQRRLRLAQARAEEAVVRVHVENALAFIDTLAEDVPFDRAIETYVRVMSVSEPLATTVITRVLVVLGRDLLPARRAVEELDPAQKPQLRLADASDRSREPRRA